MRLKELLPSRGRGLSSFIASFQMMMPIPSAIILYILCTHGVRCSLMEMKDLGALVNTYDMAAGEALGKRESHTPKIEIPAMVKAGEAVMVKVSVGPHPNTLEHSIRWIKLYYAEEGRAFNPIAFGTIEFNPGTTDPEAVFKIKFSKNGILHAVEYCNLHGLWSAKKEIKVS
jgi:superoxide reductase